MVDLAEQRLAILMISSELPEILGMSDRIAVMHAGTRAACFRRAEATPQKILSLALGMRPRADGAFRARCSSAGAGRSSVAHRHRWRCWHRAGAVSRPDFSPLENQSDLLLANMPVLIVALGMTLIILTGEIDISVGSQFAICSVAAGCSRKSGCPRCWRGLAACLAGAALGAINGALVAWVRIPSIVVTLATMVALRDGLRWATEGAWVQDLPPGFQWFGLTQSGSRR